MIEEFADFDGKEIFDETNVSRIFKPFRARRCLSGFLPNSFFFSLEILPNENNGMSLINGIKLAKMTIAISHNG